MYSSASMKHLSRSRTEIVHHVIQFVSGKGAVCTAFKAACWRVALAPFPRRSSLSIAGRREEEDAIGRNGSGRIQAIRLVP
jgi:hypothetical protein